MPLLRNTKEYTPSSWVLGYKPLIDVLCNSDTCSESQNAANTIYDQTTRNRHDTYDNRLLREHVQALTDISFSAPEVATSSTGTIITTNTAGPNISTGPHLSVHGWYPDHEGNSGSCINITNAPVYMNASTK